MPSRGNRVTVARRRAPSAPTGSSRFDKFYRNYLSERSREDSVLEERNKDVLLIESPIPDEQLVEAVTLFRSMQELFSRQVSETLLMTAAGLASIEAAQRFIQAVAPSAEVGTAQLSSLVTRLFEVRMVEGLMSSVGISEPTRDKLLDQFLQREWGPKPGETKVTVNNAARESNRSTNSVTVPRGRREGDSSRGERSTVGKSSSRRTSVGPFGALPV